MHKLLQVLALLLIGVVNIELALWGYFSDNTVVMAIVVPSTLAYLGLLSRIVFGDRDHWIQRIVHVAWNALLSDERKARITVAGAAVVVTVVGIAVYQSSFIRIHGVILFDGKPAEGEFTIELLPRDVTASVEIRGDGFTVVLPWRYRDISVFVSADSDQHATSTPKEVNVSRGATFTLPVDSKQRPGPAEPFFIVDEPYVLRGAPIVIRADNDAASRADALNVEYDGILFAGRGIPTEGGERQRWSFSLPDNQPDDKMSSLGRHELRVAFVGEFLVQTIAIILVDSPVGFSSKEPGVAATNTPMAASTLPSESVRQVLNSGRRLTEGTVKGLVVIVEFQDVLAAVDRSEVEALMNGTNYDKYGNYCSVREYFQIVSNGKLDYTTVVLGPVRLSKNRSYYQNVTELMEEALKTAVEEYNLDLSKFDSLNQGVVDAIHFLYAGRTEYSGFLWPHTHEMNTAFQGIKAGYYSLQSLGVRKEDLRIGGFCHDVAHMLCRFPDMYDYGMRDGDQAQSAGLGSYCLMAGGSFNDEGRTPAAVCAFLRDVAGWTDKEVLLNVPGRYEIAHGDYGTVYKYKTSRSNEYFIVENKSPHGLDKALPGSGLAVYHCDTEGSMEWQDGTANRHYQCALLQADGHSDLERNRNRGDLGDLWQTVDGVALSDDTDPSSRKWGGDSSGLTIRDIRVSGKTISFAVE